MKLTNLNCPQCSGLLNQERDMFFCSSCGAGFNVDYDEHDVKYNQYVTQASRSRLEVDRDIDLMKTEAQLKEAALSNAQQRYIQRSNEQLKHTAVKTIVIFVIIAVLTVGGIIGMIFMASAMFKNYNNSIKESNDHNAEVIIENIAKDEVFLDNVIRAGQMYALRNNRGQYDMSTEYYYPDGIVELYGDPQIYKIYSEHSTRFEGRAEVHLIYKLTFKYQDSDETIEMYQHVYTVVSLNEFEEIKCQFSMNSIHHYSPWNMGVYYEPEQLYRTSIMPSIRDIEVHEVEIPEDWEVAK